MILDIDAGNSRLKWRLTTRADGVTESGVVSDQAALFDCLAGLVPERIRLASVRGRDWSAAFCRQAGQHWRQSVEVASSTGHAANVTNAYAEPSALGVDRWLAMLAAHARCEGVAAVVDLGTAITLDAVGDDGRHLGGYIVPGLARQCALLEDVGRIGALASHAPGHWRVPGTSTSAAVRNGALTMVATWLGGDPLVRSAAARDGLFVTGGDAAAIMGPLGELGLVVRHEPDLVLDGLPLALP